MTFALAAASALWLGILTSISPCPLASNIAAISFLSRNVGRTSRVLLAGLCYTLGRTLAYVALAVVILLALAGSEASSAAVSRFLARYLNLLLGPILILVGMLLLGLISFGGSLALAGEGVQRRAAGGHPLWAGLLGILFALSFCPVSAGLFFGGLLTLATAQQSVLLLPALFGIGTALPVVAFALLIAFASQTVGRAFHRLTQIERWVRTATGVVFILAGIYYCLTYLFGLNLMAW